MRWLVSAVAASMSLLLLACGGGSPQGDAQSQLLLAEGEFIDTRPIRGSEEASLQTFPLPTAIARADAVVVVEILGVADATDFTSPVKDETGGVIREILVSPITTYRARVDQWIKGSGGPEMLISWWGGMTPDGPRFYDGAFLPREGRKYLLLLSPKTPELPGPGDYETAGFGNGNFEVTDGFVHVLNHPIAQDLQARFGGMPLREFVDILRDYVANPPPSPTPRPSAAEIGPPPTTSLVVNTVGIDTDVKGTAANTATSLGSLNRCNTLTSGGSLTIDITVDAVPLVGEAGGGIIAFQFVLHYDPDKVKVSASNDQMLLAANPGSSLVSLGDATPDADGSFLVAVSDFSSSAIPESGSGVLARITLEGVGPGVSELTLTDLAIADVSNARYGINSTSAAEVAVDAACPP